MVSDRGESQPLLVMLERKSTRRQKISVSLTASISAVIFLSVLFYLICYAVYQSSGTANFEATEPVQASSGTRYRCPLNVSTVKSFQSFSSYLDLSHPAKPRSFKITYDARTIRVNDSPTILIGGSIHPVRATKSTWSQALNHAVEANLNLVTIYLMWGYHQPSPHREIDWSLPGGDWDLKTAIWEAGCRGLYVHIRIGPYICGEYTYGGLPEWLPLVYGGDTNDTKMSFRCPNIPWYMAMQDWVVASVGYLTHHNLWANQGGPIILAQIENELGGAVDPKEDNIIPGKTLKDYADWCGQLAVNVHPNVVWTMCEGLSSNLTISTCNGSSCVSWIENRGRYSGQIQLDQPALWTESEMGFQMWGESIEQPSTYFWGRRVTDITSDLLRWFARGGTHVNHYMFWGGYNRGRAAAGGLMNAYATDAPVCPNGERRHPKFDHLTAFHQAIASIASVLATFPTALGRDIALEHRLMNETNWKIGQKQLAFLYGSPSNLSFVLFVENNISDDVDIRIPPGLRSEEDANILRLRPWAAVLIFDGTVLFNSSSVDLSAQLYHRKTTKSVPLYHESSWSEPIGPSDTDMTYAPVMSGSKPWEQTRLLLASNVSTDFIWYGTSLNIGNRSFSGDIFIAVETQRASAFTFFLDKEYLGSVENHEGQTQAKGAVTLKFIVPESRLRSGVFHQLNILSESFGYGNIAYNQRWHLANRIFPTVLSSSSGFFFFDMARAYAKNSF